MKMLAPRPTCVRVGELLVSVSQSAIRSSYVGSPVVTSSVDASSDSWTPVACDVPFPFPTRQNQASWSFLSQDLAGRGESVVGLGGRTCGRGQGGTTRRCWRHRGGVTTKPFGRNTSPEGYAAKGASAALPLLDDAQWHRLRRGALHLHPWRRNQTHHTFTTACLRISACLIR
jgi:hypothetical protein